MLVLSGLVAPPGRPWLHNWSISYSVFSFWSSCSYSLILFRIIPLISVFLSLLLSAQEVRSPRQDWGGLIHVGPSGRSTWEAGAGFHRGCLVLQVGPVLFVWRKVSLILFLMCQLHHILHSDTPQTISCRWNWDSWHTTPCPTKS